MGVGIIGEKLEAGVSVDALRAGTSDRVGEGIGGDHAGTWTAERAADIHGIGRRGGLGLQAVACFAQVRSLSADVPDFENPFLAEGMLHGEIPLLGVGDYVMAGHWQAENIDGRERSRAGAAARISVVRGLRGIASGETLENREAGNE